MKRSLTTARTAALPPDVLNLPSRPHRPGSGSRPDQAVLETAKAARPAITRASDWQDNKPYRFGWSLFEAGFYWEAHEVWETVWLAAPPNSLERIFLKASIQLANGRLKQVMGRSGAAQRLFDEVNGLYSELVATLGPNLPSYMGVDLAAFVTDSEQVTRNMRYNSL